MDLLDPDSEALTKLKSREVAGRNNGVGLPYEPLLALFPFGLASPNIWMPKEAISADVQVFRVTPAVANIQ